MTGSAAVSSPASKRASICGRGFTLMEVVISICILASAIIAVLTLLMALFKTSQKSVDVAVGTSIAAGIIDRYIYTTSFEQMEESIDSARGGPIHHTVEKLKGCEFTCEIKGSPVKPGQVLRLEITVSWWQEEGQKSLERTGYGRLTRELTRFVTKKR